MMCIIIIVIVIVIVIVIAFGLVQEIHRSAFYHFLKSQK